LSYSPGDFLLQYITIIALALPEKSIIEYSNLDMVFFAFSRKKRRILKQLDE